MSSTLSFQQCKERGNSFFQRCQYDQAIEWYTKAIEADPTVHAVYTNRAAALFNTDKVEDALSDAKKAVEINAQWTKGYYRIGACYLKLGKSREAVKAFTAGLETEPGNLQIKQGLADARKAVTLLPVDHHEAKQRGNDCYKLSQYEEAVKCYTQALELCPATDSEFKATLLTNRAESYRQMSMDDLTIKDCSAALDIAPDNVKALIRRGLAYERSDKLKAALADLKQALALAPDVTMSSQGVLRVSKALRQMEQCS
mmetsp:Transcript_10318/g.19548  ORF Transcript_10318/g.19548 Transcript_10318/m.19548 type:complete len:257 (-) Transcript_10318:190-960(-)